MYASNVTTKNSDSMTIRSIITEGEHLYNEKRKSENMNLKFKSSEPDLKFDIQSQFRILNQNILYLTREVDDIKRLVKRLEVDKDLQQQVDKYFEEDETSPQTDQSTK